MTNRHISTFHFLHAINSNKPHLLLPSQQRLHELHFMQKLGCQKPCWDQARLSSLVNKQVETYPTRRPVQGKLNQKVKTNVQENAIILELGGWSEPDKHI